ncbi:hypothetical protein Tco_0207893, partial [Tanacetum coccineum]
MEQNSYLKSLQEDYAARMKNLEGETLMVNKGERYSNNDNLEAWEDNEIDPMKTIEPIMHKQSFAIVVNGSRSRRNNIKVNFRTMENPKKVDNSDFVLPVTAVHAVQHKFENSLVGFFVGKKVAFPLVKNYVTNTCAKFGFEKVMSDDDGVFYFKFALLSGLEQVLEQ